MKKRILTSLVAIAFLVGTGIAEAQSRGGGAGGGHGGGTSGGGSWSGGGGGGWHGGGGSWNGGGSSWSGGSNWRGGSWNSGWHGGWNNGWNNSWHGGWNNGWNNGWRGCWNCGWNNGWWGWGGVGVGISFGFPGTWWWPGVAPAWGPAWGWNASPVQVIDQGQVVFIQRDQVADGAFTSAAPAQPAPANQYWHYCIEPPGYFPQVQQCNREWLKVVPNLNTQPAQPPQYQ